MYLYNPESFLDIRESILRVLYRWLCFVHFAFGLGFVVNFLVNLEFRIDPHFYLAVSFCLRALSNYVSFTYWSSLMLTEDSSWSSWLPVWFFQILSTTGLVTVNGLLLSGWGIYREKLSQPECVAVIYMVWLFQLARAFASHRALPMQVFFGAIAAVMVACFVDHINGWRAVATRLLPLVEVIDAAARAKLEMALRFGRVFSRVVSCGVALAALEFVLCTWSAVAAIYEEMLYFALSCADVHFFWIRAEHGGGAAADGPRPAWIGEPGAGARLLSVMARAPARGA
jgi:hypothetical protein